MANVTITGTVGSTMRAVMQSMLDLGYSAAMVAGVCGNIKHESNYNPACYTKSRNIEAFGLCQWKNNYAEQSEEGSKMTTWVGNDWKTNITKQIQYMDYTLNGGYLFLKSDMRACANTYDGSLEVTRMFLIQYEKYINYDEELPKRIPYTKEAWDAMTILI